MKTKQQKKSMQHRKKVRPSKRQPATTSHKPRAKKRPNGERAADWTHGYERGRLDGRQETIQDYALGKALWLHVAGRSGDNRQRQLPLIERGDVAQAETSELIHIRWCLVLADQWHHGCRLDFWV